MKGIIKALEDFRNAQKARVPGEPAIRMPLSGILLVENMGSGSPNAVIRLDALIQALKQDSDQGNSHSMPPGSESSRKKKR